MCSEFIQIFMLDISLMKNYFKFSISGTVGPMKLDIALAKINPYSYYQS